MFPFRRKFISSRKPPQKPAWVKWLLLGFIGYAMLMVGLSRESDTAKTIEQAKAKIENNLDLSGYKDKIFPEHAAGLRIEDSLQGSGTPAVCGQRVTLSYQTYLAQGNELPDHATQEKPLSFTIGERKTMPVFEGGVIGMKPGGKRSIIAPPLMSYGLEDFRRDDVPKGSTVRFELQLLSTEPALPDASAMPFRLADVAIGNNNPIACGEPASLRLRMWDTGGKEIYSNMKDEKPLAITPGKAQVMLGLEQGVIGMLEGGTRILIIPPEFQKTMHGKPPAIDFPLPAGQVVLVEVEAHGAPSPPDGGVR